MQLNEAVKEAIKILSEIHCGNMTPMAEEARKSAIKILEDGLQLMKQEQRPVAWIDVKPNPFDPSCRGAASVQDHALPPGEHKLYAAPKPNRQPMTYEAIYEWWRNQNSLEDLNMTKFFDFLEVVRAVEQRIELNNKYA